MRLLSVQSQSQKLQSCEHYLVSLINMSENPKISAGGDFFLVDSSEA